MAPSSHGRFFRLIRLGWAESVKLAENGARHRVELSLKPLDVEKQLLEGREAGAHSAASTYCTVLSAAVQSKCAAERASERTRGKESGTFMS